MIDTLTGKTLEHDSFEKSPWAPLRLPLYRSFWLAGFGSNLGTWMHETGAQWLMTSLDPSPTMVSGVRSAMAIPFFLLALPAGVWADRFDRRRWLMTTQAVMLCIATLMAGMAAFDLISPEGLLLLTVMMGIGMALHQPAWQALTPELVPPQLISSAVAVGSVSFNLARTLGPALAGLVIALLGTWATFFLNACSFLGIIGVLVFWKREADATDERAVQPFFRELHLGLQFVSSQAVLRNVLLRVFLFALPASIVWSLLPLVATNKLLFQERGFGICLATIGAGAVAGAWGLARARSYWGRESIIFFASLGYASMLLLIGLSSSRWVVVPGMMLIGSSWMATMTTLNATAQVNLPRKFRARGMSTYLMAFTLAMAIGSMLWGLIGRKYGLDSAFITASAVLGVVGILSYSSKL